MAEPSYKVVLLGEGRVGKTSLISRYVNERFNEQEPSTVQATMYSTKTVALEDAPAATVLLNLWDTAGQERFHALAPIYYRQAEGAVLVYDVTDADTLRRVRVWVQELRAVAGGGICIVICGNKADCPAGEWDVTEAEALALAAELGAEHFWTSAKSGKNVDTAFRQMA
ncbi:Rab family, other, partial [Strigomonas culicis]